MQIPSGPWRLGRDSWTPIDVGTTLTVRQRAKTSMTLIAPKPQLPNLHHLPRKETMGTGFHPDDERDTQLVE